MLATPRSNTISAASVPAIENSRSAYFFQYPNSRGNFARNRSYALRVVAIACGLEFRFNPPSRDSAARTNFSQCSKLSGSSSCDDGVSTSISTQVSAKRTYDFSIELLDLCRLLICPSIVEVAHCRESGNDNEWIGKGRLC